MKNVFIVLVAFLALCFLDPTPSHASPRTLFEMDYTDIAGEPEVYLNTIPVCIAGASWRLVVENGADEEGRVDSATITLNGVEVIKKSFFNRKMESIEKPVTLKRENSLDVSLPGASDGSLRISIRCTGRCPGVKLTEPAGRSAVNRLNTVVRGRLVNADGETGVRVISSGARGEADSLAEVRGTDFAGYVYLQEGVNTLTAVATDACGYRSQDSLTLNVARTRQPIRLTTSPSSGVPSTKTGVLEVRMDAETFIQRPVATYSWDIDGDGAPDHAGAGLSRLVAEYRVPGLYYPKLTVTDTAGNTYSEESVVNVISKDEVDSLLMERWNGMRAGLDSGDVVRAASYFYERRRDVYLKRFIAMRPVLKQMSEDMKDLRFVKTEGRSAIYELVSTKEGKPLSFQVTFVKNDDGLWKIHGF